MKLTKSDRGGFCWDLAGARRGRPRPLADRRGPGTRPHRGRAETWGAATSRRRGDLLAGGAQTAGDPEVQFTDGQHGDLGCGNLADAWHGDLPDGGVRTAGDLEGQFTDARQPTEASASTGTSTSNLCYIL